MISLRREVHRGMVGPDCWAIKRALWKAGYRRGIAVRGPRKRKFGRFAVRALKRWQKAHGLRADGVYGPATHRKLVAAGKFDAFGKQLMSQAPKAAALTSKRQSIVRAAIYVSQHRAAIHYTQSSLRMQGISQGIRLPGFPRYADCSSLCCWFYWLVGALALVGGAGYTGTQIQHGRRISESQIQPADLVFYGGWFFWSAPTHVAVYIGAGKIVSHGSESGPQVLSMHYRRINRIISYLPKGA
jgi:hypothetical protein